MTTFKRGRFSDPRDSFAARTKNIGDCLIWTGSTNDSGYGRIWVRGRMESAHRFAWEQVHGPIPDGLHVDHKEHCDPACCNVEHLRLATPSQNASNRLGPQSNNRTGIRNVSRHKNRWRVQIYKDGKRRFNKSFDSLADAAEAAEEERNRIFGSFAGQL